MSIVKRALTLFDRVVIGIGINSEKTQSDDVNRQADKIRSYFTGNPEVEVRIYEGLTAQEAQKAGCSHLLRSVRSTSDFEYERNLADANRNIFGIDTFILYAEPELSYISSSLVRELNRHGVDTSNLLPK